MNPDGNARLTAAVGLLLLLPIAAELLTVPLGVHAFMSVHVFVGFVLIPLVVLKLVSTGWRFARYYTRCDPYRALGPPRLAMRMLAPLFVAATVVLFTSGVAMGLVHGQALVVARRLHGPSSAAWAVLVGLHVLVYLKRGLQSGTEDVISSKRGFARGVGARVALMGAALVCGFVIAAATVPAQHHWIDLSRDRHDHRGERR